MQIEDRLKQFIAQQLLFSEEGFTYSLDDSFMQKGIIDSLGIMELVTFAGKEFGIAIEPEEVTPDNFDSIHRLAAFIRRKRDPAAATAVA
jgi:acyl carrier protein